MEQLAELRVIAVDGVYSNPVGNFSFFKPTLFDNISNKVVFFRALPPADLLKTNQ